jgi:hypothetical protein
MEAGQQSGRFKVESLGTWQALLWMTGVEAVPKNFTAREAIHEAVQNHQAKLP